MKDKIIEILKALVDEVEFAEEFEFGYLGDYADRLITLLQPADGEEVVSDLGDEYWNLICEASDYLHKGNKALAKVCMKKANNICNEKHAPLNSLRSEVSDVDKWDIEEIVEELKDLDFFDAAKAMFEKWSHVTKKSKLKEETN